MDVLVLLAIAVPGFTGCAEFGSYAFVHPVIKKLAPRDHIMVEQGLVRTFGRVMPFLMTASVIILISFAIASIGLGVASVLLWIAAVVWSIGLVTTILVNVKINFDTSRWDADQPPEQWKQTRRRWEFFQGVRSWAFLIAFVLVAGGVAVLPG